MLGEWLIIVVPLSNALEETELRIRVMTWKEKWLNKDLPELGKDRKIETSIEGS